MLRSTIAPCVRAAATPFDFARRVYRGIADAIPEVTPWHRWRFARNGFLPIDPRFPDHLIEQVKVEAAPFFEALPPDAGEYPVVGRVHDAWTLCPAVKELMTWPRVLDILRALYGREPMPFQSLNFPVGSEQPIHSDTIHFNSTPAGWMCGVWIALEDIDETNGPLVYYPGSHKLPEYTLADVPAPVVVDSYETYPLYEQFIAKKVSALRLRPRYARLRKGQAMIWAANLWHGGSPRTDRTRSRYSQVNHYFFPGCRYYTPLYSTPAKVFWRNPIHVK